MAYQHDRGGGLTKIAKIALWQVKSHWVQPKPYRVRYLKDLYRPLSYNGNADIFKNLLEQNLLFSALPEYLRYEDRMSMAFTVEARLPFMDYRLVEWAMQLPNHFKIENGVSKRILRQFSRKLIPAAVANRRDKMGFVTPQQIWQKHQLRSLILDTINGIDGGIFEFIDTHQVKAVVNSYFQGKSDDWALVWRFFCLYCWISNQNNGLNYV